MNNNTKNVLIEKIAEEAKPGLMKSIWNWTFNTRGDMPERIMRGAGKNALLGALAGTTGAMVNRRDALEGALRGGFLGGVSGGLAHASPGVHSLPARGLAKIVSLGGGYMAGQTASPTEYLPPMPIPLQNGAIPPAPQMGMSVYPAAQLPMYKSSAVRGSLKNKVLSQ